VAHLGCILLGAPGSGKGTQAKILHRSLRIPHISTGDILRSEVQKKSALGLKVSEILASGQLVNDDLMKELVRVRLGESDAVNGYILDGYPRNKSQAEVLDQIIQSLKYFSPVAVYIELPESNLLARIVGRLSCGSCGSIFHEVLNPPKVALVCDSCGGDLMKRKDDTESTVKKRLEIYREETAPLLDFYKARGVLQTVSGLQKIEQITKDIEAALKTVSAK